MIHLFPLLPFIARYSIMLLYFGLSSHPPIVTTRDTDNYTPHPVLETIRRGVDVGECELPEKRDVV